MKNQKSALLVLAFVLLPLNWVVATNAPKLTFTFNKVHLPPGQSYFPGGVNNAGEIVGFYVDNVPSTHCFTLKGTTFTIVDDPNGTNSVCDKINNKGAIVGSYQQSVTGIGMGFLYENGQFTDIAGPGGATPAAAMGINDNGDVVGTYMDINGIPHGFLLKGTTYVTLDVPGALFTIARGINNHGIIVLDWFNGTAYESSRYDGQMYKTIDVPGASKSLAKGISNTGDIVYEWYDPSGNVHGALRHLRKYYKFNFPKSGYTFGAGINDHQLIVGPYAKDGSSATRAYRATYK